MLRNDKIIFYKNLISSNQKKIALILSVTLKTKLHILVIITTITVEIRNRNPRF